MSIKQALSIASVASVAMLALGLQGLAGQDLSVTTMDVGTGEPLANVGVSIQQGDRVVRVRTDDAGQATVALAVGETVIHAERAGYVGRKSNGDAEVRVRIAKEGQSAVSVELVRAAIIEGRVLDAVGRPIEGAQVAPFVLAYDETGRQGPEYLDAVQTNDLGRFRLNRLPEGEIGLRVEPARETVSSGHLIAPMFFPGELSIERAELVVTRSGSTVRVPDTILRSVTGGAVSLRIVNETSEAPIPDSVELSYRRLAEGGTPRWLTGRQEWEQFRVERLLPGQYSFTVSFATPSGIAKGVQVVTVPSAGEVSLIIPVRAEVEVRGRVVAMGGNGVADAVSLSGLTLRLVDREDVRIHRTLISDEAGALTPLGTGALVEGRRYRVEIGAVPEGMYVAGVFQDDDDILPTGLNVTSQAAVVLEIALAGPLGVVQGIVRDASGRPVPGAVVVLAPFEPRAGYRVEAVRTWSDGSFEFRSRPGEYGLLSWRDVPSNAYLNPEFVARYSRKSVGIELRPAERLSATLEIIEY